VVSSDPFPREAFGALVRRLPAYGRLAWRLGRDPLLSKGRRAAVLAAAGYVASPIDLLPGVIPVLGQLDDIAVALAALKMALRGLDPARREEHLRTVGLNDSDLMTDLGTLRASAAWIVRSGARAGARTLNAGLRASVEGGRRVGGIAGRLGRSAAERLGAVVPRADRRRSPG
jgi:uncharacterized membrane protein YkvA (DUF1232 family)